MRTNNNNLLYKIIEILTNADIKNKDKINKNALLKYIQEEFLNLDEYKELIEDIKLSKEDILEILYQILTLVNNDTKKYNNMQETKNLIKIANNYGFTWPNSNSCFNKVEEEFMELKNAIKENNEKNIKEEIGDLLFSLHCYTNIKNFDNNQILNDANKKFEKRFTKLLEIAKSKNIDLVKCSSELKEELWKEAKKSIYLS